MDKKWESVAAGDLNIGDRARVESTSRFTPAIAFEGLIVGSFDGLRLELDISQPVLSMFEAKDYRFFKEVSE